MTDTTTPSTPATPAEATSRIIALQRDPGFFERTGSVDPLIRESARAELASLEKIEAQEPAAAPAAPLQIAAGGPAPAGDTAARDVARAKEAALMADPAFMARWHAGDRAAHAELSKVIEEAYPGETDGRGMSIDEDAQPAATDEDVPSEPGRYQLDYSTVVGELNQPLDTEFRQMAHAAKLPEPIARHAFKFWNKAVADAKKTGKGLSDVDLQLKTQSTAAKLQHRWGDQYQVKLDAAKSIIHALPEAQRARAMLMLERSGLGADEHFIIQLADLAERKAARKK